MADTDPHRTDVPTLEIDWLKTAAGALAAVTTAVLLSTLGAVGTLIGAALGSVGATLGSAIYAQGLARSKQAVLKAQETAMAKVGVAQTEVRRAARRHDEGDETAAEAHLEAADERLGEARGELQPDPDAERTSWVRGLPWKRIAALAAATFVVVMVTITAFEKLTGDSVSHLTGGSDSNTGTTFGGVTGGGTSDDGGGKDDGGGTDDPTVKPSDSESPTDEPSESPTEEPTESPTEEPTEEPTETPTQTPTPTPSETPTPSPTANPSPTASSTS